MLVWEFQLRKTCSSFGCSLFWLWMQFHADRRIRYQKFWAKPPSTAIGVCGSMWGFICFGQGQFLGLAPVAKDNVGMFYCLARIVYIWAGGPHEKLHPNFSRSLPPEDDLSKVTSHFEEVFRFMDAGRATGKVLVHCFEGKNRWVDRVVGTTWKKHVLKIGSIVSLLLFRALDATVCAHLEGHKIILWFQIKPAWKFTLIDCQSTVRQPDLHSWLMPVVFCTEKPEVMMSWWLDFCCFNNQSLTSDFFLAQECNLCYSISHAEGRLQSVYGIVSCEVRTQLCGSDAR